MMTKAQQRQRLNASIQLLKECGFSVIYGSGSTLPAQPSLDAHFVIVGRDGAELGAINDRQLADNAMIISQAYKNGMHFTSTKLAVENPAVKLCLYQHHTEYGKPLKCPKCGQNNTMHCGPFNHACEVCDPIMCKPCLKCGESRYACTC